MEFVLDASVTLNWFFRDETTEAGARLRRSLLDGRALVPAVRPIEVGKVFVVAPRKGRIASVERRWKGVHRGSESDAVNSGGPTGSALSGGAGRPPTKWPPSPECQRLEVLSRRRSSGSDRFARDTTPDAIPETRRRATLFRENRFQWSASTASRTACAT